MESLKETKRPLTFQEDSLPGISKYIYFELLKANSHITDRAPAMPCRTVLR
jgi:hypothetical protein